MSSDIQFGIPICPITQIPIQDPVIDPEGNSYEKAAILTWLVENSISPVTRTPLFINQLIPNRALIDMIGQNKTASSISSSNSSNSLKNCDKCNKTISVSRHYKGKKNPICFNCRPWNCTLCTYINNSNLTRCDMCDAARR